MEIEYIYYFADYYRTINASAMNFIQALKIYNNYNSSANNYNSSSNNYNSSYILFR